MRGAMRASGRGSSAGPALGGRSSSARSSHGRSAAGSFPGRGSMTGETAGKPTRVVGVDLARALAVLGMFASHVGPDPDAGGVNTILQAASGRASALFAFLAGVSLVLM